MRLGRLSGCWVKFFKLKLVKNMFHYFVYQVVFLLTIPSRIVIACSLDLCYANLLYPGKKKDLCDTAIFICIKAWNCTRKARFCGGGQTKRSILYARWQINVTLINWQSLFKAYLQVRSEHTILVKLNILRNIDILSNLGNF